MRRHVGEDAFGGFYFVFLRAETDGVYFIPPELLYG